MENVGLLRIFLFLLNSLTFSEISAHKRATRSPVEEFQKYEIIRPQIFRGNTHLQSTLTEGGHYTDVSITLPVFTRTLILDLWLNNKLFSGKYVEKYFNAQEEEVVYTPNNHTSTHCYYHGRVRDAPGSTVALSTCHGISGYIADQGGTYYISPVQSVIDGEHYIFLDTDRITDNFTCGHSGPLHDHVTTAANRASRLKRDIHWPYDTTDDTKIVELYIANDNKQYKTYDEDIAKVIARSKEVVNIVSSLYRPLNIYVALVGVEIWTTKDKIDVVDNAGTTMNNFLEYRKVHINPQHRNDNAQLLTGHTFSDGVVGKAPIYTICTFQYSGGVNMDHSVLVGPVATTVAHEMGHNFGLKHDVDSCDCDADRCIMAPSSGGVKNPTKWSSCSLEEFSDAFHQGMDYCLHNLPDSLEGSVSVCGNGFMEDGEECDCGLTQDCDNPCCIASTCRLAPNATCATGQCCDKQTCQLVSKAEVCRKAQGECDLSEHCSGLTEFCPHDVHVQDGATCDKGQAFCYRGQCRSRDSQCKKLWGRTGSEAHSSCYTHYNPMGIAAGNCGFNWLNTSFVACKSKDVMCGMLHCVHRSEKLMFWKEALAYTMPEPWVMQNGVRHDCKAGILDVGLNQVDPGMVPSGAKCGDHMMCVDQECRPIPELEVLECPDCHGNGICNSIGQCHCEVGYAPPLCNKRGHGGSEHSGPISDKTGSDNSLVIAMCVIFLVIIPLLVVVTLCAYCKKERLKEIWLGISKAKPPAERYRSIYRANPRNDAVKPPEKKSPPVVPPPPTTKPSEVKRSGSFRPEDISRPSLQSSTNKTVHVGLPQAHGSTGHGHVQPQRSAPPPPGAGSSGQGRPLPTRPAPSRPGINRSPSACGASEIKVKPVRPPQPNLQRSKSTASEPVRPRNLPVQNTTPQSHKYENTRLMQSPKQSEQNSEFRDVPLNSPGDSPRYANEPDGQPIRSGGIKDKIHQLESCSGTGSGSSSSSSAVKRTPSAPTGKRPAVAPKPSFKVKAINNANDPTC